MELPLSDLITMRRTTKDDMHLQAYDHTRLTAINTCPTWGLVRYGLGKTMHTEGESSQALNAGTAAHEFFAAVRVWQLAYKQGLTAHAHVNGLRLFGQDRHQAAWESAIIRDVADDTRGLHYALDILYSSGFTDSPYDRRRTMANIEAACMNYYTRWDWRHKVWVADVNDPKCAVGVEQAFDLVVEFKRESTTELTQFDYEHAFSPFRFVGKIDGIHLHGDVFVGHENKTASRMDEAWRSSWLISHQPTGYMVAASWLFGILVERSAIIGMQIPQPRSLIDGIHWEDVHRERHHYEQWLDWVLYTIAVEQRYRHDPANAPKFAHSCSRYFRACEMIPLCYSNREERAEILDSMTHQPWSPLEEKTGD